MGQAINRCCNILTSFRTPIVWAAWASFFIFWLRRWWVVFDLSLIAPRRSSLVIIAIGACGVAIGWWLCGRWVKQLALSDATITLSDVSQGNVVCVYADSQTSNEWTIEDSNYRITWDDGQQDGWAQG